MPWPGQSASRAPPPRTRAKTRGKSPATIDPNLARMPYPEARPELVSETAEADMELLKAVVTGVRNIRAELNINPGLKLTALVHADNPQQVASLTANTAMIDLFKLLKVWFFGQYLSPQPGADLYTVNNDGYGEVHQASVTGIRIGFTCFHRHLAAFHIVFRTTRRTFFRGANQAEAKGAKFIKRLLFYCCSIKFHNKIGEASHFVKKKLKFT